MFANFTEETCTGTGATMALAGATTGNIQFSKTFADGDLVSYSIEDSGGTTRVAGIGTYVSATDDITRNDTWNWNGTSVDKNPATNITLSGGTHTIRCTPVTNTAPAFPTPDPLIISGTAVKAINCGSVGFTFGGFTANRIYYMPFNHVYDRSYTTIGFEIAANAGVGNCRVGIYSCGVDGLPDKLIADSGAISTAATGFNEATVSAFYLPKGQYWSAILSDFAFDPTAGDASADQSNFPTVTLSTDPSLTLSHIYAAQTYGALPDPATTGSLTEQSGRSILIYLK